MFKLVQLGSHCTGTAWPSNPPLPPSKPPPNRNPLPATALFCTGRCTEMFKFVHYETRTVGKQACWHPTGIIFCICCKHDDRRFTLCKQISETVRHFCCFFKNLIQAALHSFVFFLSKKAVLLQFKKNYCSNTITIHEREHEFSVRIFI